MTQKKDSKKTADREIHFMPGAQEIMNDDSTAQVKVVRVGRKSRGRCIEGPEDVVDFWKRIVARRPWFDADREFFVALLLDVKNNLKAWSLAGIGTVDSCLVDHIGVFRCAVACSASHVIMAHHHPTGCSLPSQEDIKLTHALIAGGKLLRITVEDHVVVGDAEFSSIRCSHPDMFDSDSRQLDMAANI